jgi:hypothetical protein
VSLRLEQYLNDVEAAKRITREVVALYRRFGVTPLVESAVKKKADFTYMSSILGEECPALTTSNEAVVRDADDLAGDDTDATTSQGIPSRSADDMKEMSREQLEKAYLHLTKVELPALAATYRLPLRFDHCFMRVVLDNTFEDCWYNHLDRKLGALRSISDDRLVQALSLARSIKADRSGDVLRSLNARSLKWRGRQKAGGKK